MEVNKCWYKDVCKETCSNGCLRYNLMKSLCQQSNIPEPRWENVNLFPDVCDEIAFNILTLYKRNVLENVTKGRNLYIYSKICGNGKTTWAIKLMLSYFDKIWHTSGFSCKGLFINVPTFLYENKSNINNPTPQFIEMLEKINKVPLIIWDDIGNSTLTTYEHQILLNYIDSRTIAGKANIFTSNCDQELSRRILGEKLYSRIWETSIKVQFSGSSKREVVK